MSVKSVESSAAGATTTAARRSTGLPTLGRVAVRHPGRTIALWVLVVVASFVCAPVLFSSMTSEMGGRRKFGVRSRRRPPG